MSAVLSGQIRSEQKEKNESGWHLVSVEERFSWLKKQKEHKTVSTASNGLIIFVEYTETIWEC